MDGSTPNTSDRIRERFQWGSYGFVPGLLIGIVLGWIFSVAIGWIFRFGIALLVLIVLVGLFFAWRWWTTRGDSQVVVYEYSNRRPDEAIESTSRVVDVADSSSER
jgi:hypothetical protein